MDATLILSTNVEYPAMFERLAHLAVPTLADWCAIDVSDENGGFQRVAAAHVDKTKASLAIELQTRFAADPKLDTGFPKVLRTGKSELWPDVLPSQLVASSRSPEHLALMQKLGFHSYMCVPLLARGRTLGSMTFVSASAARHFTPDDLAVAEELARRAAITLDNARLLHETEQARRRAALLAEVSRLLAATENPRSIMKEIATLAVPDLGDWCAIRLLDENEVDLAPAIVAHVDPKMLELAKQMRERWPELSDDIGPARVLRTGKAEFYPEIQASHYEKAARDEEHLRLLKLVGTRSAIIVPVKVHDRVFGTISFAANARRFSEADLALAEDLAHRVALAIENARLHASAAEAIRARDELFSVASHEMRTPLGALHLMMRVLRNSIDSGRSPQEIAKDLEAKIATADRQVTRVTKFVNKLLDISKLKAGRMLLEREEVDVTESAQEVIARFAEEAGRVGSPLVLEARGPVTGFYDRFRIEQIFTNLISNAIKYGEGKPVTVRVMRQGSAVRIEVQDRGIGISDEQRQKLFERHARGQKAYEGLGLGLYILREIVEESGGTIDLESAVGKGSTFIVVLPLQPPEKRPE